MEEELSARAVVEHEEELVARLKGHGQAHDEGVVHVAQYVALGARVFHLVLADDEVFLEHLQSRRERGREGGRAEGARGV